MRGQNHSQLNNDHLHARVAGGSSPVPLGSHLEPDREQVCQDPSRTQPGTDLETNRPTPQHITHNSSEVGQGLIPRLIRLDLVNGRMPNAKDGRQLSLR